MSLLVAIVVLVLLFIIGATVGAVLRGKSSGSSVGYPYQPAKILFSAAERSFLGALDLALGSKYRIFGKVRVADVANVKPGLGRSARQGALNRIAGKHLDFVVCRASDLSLVCAIELNDKSHGSQRARARDDFLANVCRTIGLPLLAIPARQTYPPEELRARFQSIVPTPSTATSANAMPAERRPQHGSRTVRPDEKPGHSPRSPNT